MLIGQNGKKLGFLHAKDALDKAQSSNVDLVQVSPIGAEPVVCKLMDYGKHLFAKKKSYSSSKSKVKKNFIKRD